MKLKARKARYLNTHQNNTQSEIPESVLHAFSQNLEPRIFSKSFAYGPMLATHHESSSLSNWGQNQATAEAATAIKDSSIEVALPISKKQQKRVPLNYLRNEANDHVRDRQFFHKSRTFISNGSTRFRANTTRTKCTINIVSPKFDDEKVQSKIFYVNAHSFASQMRETMRERKGIIMKRIRKDSTNPFQSKSEEKCCLPQQKLSLETDTREKEIGRYNLIQLKFTESEIEYSSHYSKNAKETNSQRVSRLLAYKNPNAAKGKHSLKKEHLLNHMHAKSDNFQSIQEVKTLRSLINREGFERISGR